MNIEDMTDEQLMDEQGELYNEVWEKLAPYYTLEANPLSRLLAIERKLTLKEGE